MAADVGDLDDTYEAWYKNAKVALKNLRRQGMRIEPVEIDIDGLLRGAKLKDARPTLLPAPPMPRIF